MNNNRRAHRRVAGSPLSAPSPIWNPGPIVCPFSATFTPGCDLLFAEYCNVDIIVVTEIVHDVNRDDQRTIKILIFGGLPFDRTPNRIVRVKCSHVTRHYYTDGAHQAGLEILAISAGV